MLTGKTRRGVELWRLSGVGRMNKGPEWVVVGDGTQMVIYQLESGDNSLKTIRRLEFPKGRAKTHEMLADHAGRKNDRFHPRASAGTAARYGVGDDYSFHDLYIDEMSRRVATLLSKARSENLFSRLTLIAEPRLMGHLKRHLDEQTRDRIENIIEKDYARYTVPALLGMLKKRH